MANKTIAWTNDDFDQWHNYMRRLASLWYIEWNAIFRTSSEAAFNFSLSIYSPQDI